MPRISSQDMAPPNVTLAIPRQMSTGSKMLQMSSVLSRSIHKPERAATRRFLDLPLSNLVFSPI